MNAFLLILLGDHFGVLGIVAGMRATGATDKVRLILVGQVLERPSLGLGEKQRREDACQHEQSKDLEDVLEKLAASADVDETSETDLSDDGSEFA
jgi:hypothetical protein